MLKLASATDPAWGHAAADHLDEILLDHAHCEKKAAGVAVTLLFRAPERAGWMGPLSALAREELGHFEAVLVELSRRGQAFRRQRPSAYAGRLRAAIRPREPEQLLDGLLCSALIEARSCERLGLLAEALPEPRLADFYRGLCRAEARHHGLYVELACDVAPRAVVAARLGELAAHEAGVLADARREARLHSRAPRARHAGGTGAGP
jgi:tRNA-(ms[2]io[6]A)-hydroxylase